MTTTTETEAGERIDHAALALELIEGSQAEQDMQAAALILAEAQVQATLAVAEQQRIANLIAWTTANGEEPTDAAIDEIDRGLGGQSERHAGWVLAPDGEEFRPGECQGHAQCPAEDHIEGCFATARETGR